MSEYFAWWRPEPCSRDDQKKSRRTGDAQGCCQREFSTAVIASWASATASTALILVPECCGVQPVKVGCAPLRGAEAPNRLR